MATLMRMTRGKTKKFILKKVSVEQVEKKKRD